MWKIRVLCGFDFTSERENHIFTMKHWLNLVLRKVDGVTVTTDYNLS